MRDFANNYVSSSALKGYKDDYVKSLGIGSVISMILFPITQAYYRYLFFKLVLANKVSDNSENYKANYTKINMFEYFATYPNLLPSQAPDSGALKYPTNWSEQIFNNLIPFYKYPHKNEKTWRLISTHPNSYFVNETLILFTTTILNSIMCFFIIKNFKSILPEIIKTDNYYINIIMDNIIGLLVNKYITPYPLDLFYKTYSNSIQTPIISRLQVAEDYIKSLIIHSSEIER